MPARFEVYKDFYGSFRFRLVSSFDEILREGGPYETKEECLEAIQQLKSEAKRTAAPVGVQVLPERRIEKPPSEKIFIVHGKDESNKKLLKDMIAGWGLKPIILAEEPNRGRTLIEKLLDHTSDVGFAFVLMTPDDVGASYDDFQRFKKDITESADLEQSDAAVKGLDCFKLRVRQNVILEYGLCIGSLKRERVCPLVKRGDIEIPTDILGYGYHSFTDNVVECKDGIRRELEAVGYQLR